MDDPSEFTVCGRCNGGVKNRLGICLCLDHAIFSSQEQSHSNGQNVVRVTPLTSIDPRIYMAILIGVISVLELEGFDTLDKPLAPDLRDEFGCGWPVAAKPGQTLVGIEVKNRLLNVVKGIARGIFVGVPVAEAVQVGPAANYQAVT